MLDPRFSYENFAADFAAGLGDETERTQSLALALAHRLQAAAAPADAGYAIIDDLRALGHELSSFDESDDFQAWMYDYSQPQRRPELYVHLSYRDGEPRAVAVEFGLSPRSTAR